MTNSADLALKTDEKTMIFFIYAWWSCCCSRRLQWETEITQWLHNNWAWAELRCPSHWVQMFLMRKHPKCTEVEKTSASLIGLYLSWPTLWYINLPHVCPLWPRSSQHITLSYVFTSEFSEVDFALFMLIALLTPKCIAPLLEWCCCCWEWKNPRLKSITNSRLHNRLCCWTTHCTEQSSRPKVIGRTATIERSPRFNWYWIKH